MEASATETAHHSESLFHDPHFWVAVAFVTFLALFVKYILPSILSMLDKRSAAIADQLEQANRLRAEAEALLNASRIQQEELQREAEEVLAQAQRDAKEIGLKAAADLEHYIARRMAQTDENIARAEINAVAGLRAQMIEVATETARQVILTQLQNQHEDISISRALESMERQIH